VNRLRGLWPESGGLALAGALATWLALLSWAPFHERPGTYVVPLLGLALAVALIGTALRSFRVPVGVVPVLQLGLLLVWFNHEWAAGWSWQGWVPTPSSLAQVQATLAAAVETARTYQAPIDAEVTTFAPLMLASGATVAVVVDLIAAGLRRAPVAGLPLLAVYTAPVSILERGVPWWAFAFAGLGFLVLVAAQEETRLSRWGRNVSGSGRLQDSQSAGVSPSAVWGSARRIGLTATGLAVLVPLAVPTLSLSLVDGAGRGAGGGGDAVSVDNPIVDMRRDLSRGTDVDMVRVRTDDPDLGYLRFVVLDAYDGDTWRPAESQRPPDQAADGPVETPPGLDGPEDAPTHDWEVEVLGEYSYPDWLPTPYPVTSIVAEGDWRYDRDTMDFTSFDSQNARGMTYSLRRLVVEPDPEAMAFAPPAPASVFGPNTELPEDLPEFVAELADEVTADARSRYEKAVALQDWFRADGNFEYTLKTVPGNGVDDLERFLTAGPDGRKGYCEQFAAAMAVMGRTLNIPTRVAVGFLRPQEESPGVYVYSAHDMHAWPEMYFEDTGWVTFEPTPGGRGYTVPDYTRADVNRPENDPSATASSSASDGPDQTTDPRLDPGAVPGAGGGGTGGRVAGFLMGALLGLLVALTPRLARAWVRRRRWAGATTAPALAEAAWDELRDTARDLRIAWNDRETLRTRSRALVSGFGRPGSDEDALGRASERGPGADPEAENALERLVVLVERARFSRGLPVDATTADQVQADVATCAAALRTGVGRRRARRAEWLPASLWSARGSASHRFGGFSLGETGVDRAV